MSQYVLDAIANNAGIQSFGIISIQNLLVNGQPYNPLSPPQVAPNTPFTVTYSARNDSTTTQNIYGYIFDLTSQQQLSPWGPTPVASGASYLSTNTFNGITSTFSGEVRVGHEVASAIFTATATTGGYITGTANGAWPEGTYISVTANANTGYTFVNWTGSLGTTNPTLTFYMGPSPVTVQANFIVTAQNCTSPTGTNGGYVCGNSANPNAPIVGHRYQCQNGTWYDLGVDQTNCPIAGAIFTATATTGGYLTGTANGSWPEGTAISVTAHANTGYTFVNWTGSLGTTNPTLSFNMGTSPVTVQANFIASGCTSPTGNTGQIICGNSSYGQNPKNRYICVDGVWTDIGWDAVCDTAQPCTNPTGSHGQTACGDAAYGQNPKNRYQCTDGVWTDIGWDAVCDIAQPCTNPTATHGQVFCGDPAYGQDPLHQYQCNDGVWQNIGYDPRCETPHIVCYRCPPGGGKTPEQQEFDGTACPDGWFATEPTCGGGIAINPLFIVAAVAAVGLVGIVLLVAKR
jgi:uncharacterized repeat protein (TIGR02543 family)